MIQFPVTIPKKARNSYNKERYIMVTHRSVCDHPNKITNRIFLYFGENSGPVCWFGSVFPPKNASEGRGDNLIARVR